MQHLWCVTSLQSLGSLTLRFGGTRKKMLVNWISHSSGRYRAPSFGHQKCTFLSFAWKKWNHLARTTLTDFVTSRDVTEPIKPVRWRFGLRALALRGGSSICYLLREALFTSDCAERAGCKFVSASLRSDYNHFFPCSIWQRYSVAALPVLWH